MTDSYKVLYSNFRTEDILKNTTLSWVSKGIISFINFSRIKNINVDYLSDMGTDKPELISDAIKELEKYKFIEKTR